MAPVGIGMVGAGFVAGLHARAYRSMGESAARIVAVTSRSAESAETLADHHGIASVERDFASLLQREDVDIVDLCVPNALHEPLAIAAAEAGKHVICEKPLTGCFVTHAPDGRPLRKSEMLSIAMASADRMLAACERNGVRLMYGENWAYMPAVERLTELVLAGGGSVLEVRAEESHHGSHSQAAQRWADSGGGALMMLGAHPIGAALQLKRAEGIHRDGTPIRPRSVLAQTADLTQVASFDASSASVLSRWQDVENWATCIITFEDGSRAVITASYNCVGGMRDTVEVYASNARFQCDLTRSSMLQAYAPNEDVFAGIDLSEKLETNAGWSYPYVADDVLQGYQGELVDFVRSASAGTTPKSDGALGRDVLAVIYASYASAEEGKPVSLTGGAPAVAAPGDSAAAQLQLDGGAR